MIELKNLSKVYDNGRNRVEAIKDINLTIEDGDIFGIIGLSGQEYAYPLHQFSGKAYGGKSHLRRGGPGLHKQKGAAQKETVHVDDISEL